MWRYTSEFGASLSRRSHRWAAPRFDALSVVRQRGNAALAPISGRPLERPSQTAPPDLCLRRAFCCVPRSSPGDGSGLTHCDSFTEPRQWRSTSGLGPLPAVRFARRSSTVVRSRRERGGAVSVSGSPPMCAVQRGVRTRQPVSRDGDDRHFLSPSRSAVVGHSARSVRRHRGTARPDPQEGPCSATARPAIAAARESRAAKRLTTRRCALALSGVPRCDVAGTRLRL